VSGVRVVADLLFGLHITGLVSHGGAPEYIGGRRANGGETLDRNCSPTSFPQVLRHRVLERVLNDIVKLERPFRAGFGKEGWADLRNNSEATSAVRREADYRHTGSARDGRPL
jgi:hypothetical protein